MAHQHEEPLTVRTRRAHVNDLREACANGDRAAVTRMLALMPDLLKWDAAMEPTSAFMGAKRLTIEHSCPDELMSECPATLRYLSSALMAAIASEDIGLVHLIMNGRDDAAGPRHTLVVELLEAARVGDPLLLDALQPFVQHIPERALTAAASVAAHAGHAGAVQRLLDRIQHAATNHTAELHDSLARITVAACTGAHHDVLALLNSIECDACAVRAKAHQRMHAGEHVFVLLHAVNDSTSVQRVCEVLQWAAENVALAGGDMVIAGDLMTPPPSTALSVWFSGMTVLTSRVRVRMLMLLSSCVGAVPWCLRALLVTGVRAPDVSTGLSQVQAYAMDINVVVGGRTIFVSDALRGFTDAYQLACNCSGRCVCAAVHMAVGVDCSLAVVVYSHGETELSDQTRSTSPIPGVSGTLAAWAWLRRKHALCVRSMFVLEPYRQEMAALLGLV